jgi:hypothetical protein
MVAGCAYACAVAGIGALRVNDKVEIGEELETSIQEDLLR